MDILFSAAFALVLVDTITPSTGEQWDIREAFSLLDYMIGRGINPATVYKEHLVELNEFRIMLRQRESQTSQRAREEFSQVPESGHVGPQLLGDIGRESGEPGSNLDLEQESIWAWMSMGNNELALVHPDTMQTAITGLNTGSMPPDFDGNNQWMWGSYAVEDEIDPLSL
jgi:hypothetical protein